MSASALYRARSRVRHQLTAWHTGGEGIHSPTLFYLVRMIIYDDNAYYAYRTIEQKRQSVSPKLGRLLFRLINHLTHEQREPLTVVEVGEDSAGAYLTAPAQTNKVLSYDSLPPSLPKQVDLAFVNTPDAAAALQCCRQLLPCMRDHSLLVVADIHRSPEMTEAWQQLQAEQRVTSTLDLYDIGIVVFNRHYLHKNYRLRF